MPKILLIHLLRRSIYYILYLCRITSKKFKGIFGTPPTPKKKIILVFAFSICFSVMKWCDSQQITKNIFWRHYIIKFIYFLGKYFYSYIFHIF